MSEAIEEKLFARKSSGLVREASPAQATFFNIAALMGSKFAWSATALGTFPVLLILGYSPYLWAVLLFGLASCLLGVIYVQIVTPMPRSGADYVVPARLMGPFWGFINSWMIVWSYIPVWAYATWARLRDLKLLFDMLNIAKITPTAPWILVPPAELVLGVVLLLTAMGLCLLPPRKYYRLIAVMGVIAVASLILIGLAAAFNVPSVFSQNLKSIAGLTSTELIQKATKDGFDPNRGFDSVAIAGLAGYVLFVIGGFQASASISGELRGDVKKSLTISILGSLVFFMIYSLIFVWFLLQQFGYDLLTRWSFLFWNARADAPLSLPPINALLATLSAPTLWWLWTISSVVSLIGAWIMIPTIMIYINRLILAWGIDRMLPKSLSEVHPKFRQPVKLVCLEGALAIIFFLVLVYAPNFNPLNYPYWSVLMVMPSYIFPAICALLIPRRRPDLLKAVPWRKWLVPVAVLWLIIIIPFYAFAGFIGSVRPPTAGTDMWQYAISTGLAVTLLTILIGVGIFYVVRSYNLKRGIDVNKIYQTIPPE